MEEMESSQKSIILFYQQIQKKKNETTFLLSGSHSPTVFESRIGEEYGKMKEKFTYRP